MAKLRNVTIELQGVEREFPNVGLEVDDKEDSLAVHNEILANLTTYGYEFGGIESATVEVQYRITGSVTIELEDGVYDLSEYDNEDELEYAVENDPESFGVYEAIQEDVQYNADAEIERIDVSVEEG